MIIKNNEDLQKLLARTEKEDHVICYINRDPKQHHMANEMLLATVTFKNLDSFTVSMSHDDCAFKVPEYIFNTRTKSRRFVTTSKYDCCSTDIGIISYISEKQIPQISNEFSKFINQTLYTFDYVPDVNKVVPLVLWAFITKSYNTKLWEVIEESTKAIDSDAYHTIKNTVDVLGRIEANGLAVDNDLFTVHFGTKLSNNIVDGLVYSEYNPFTTTGRPSNRYGGINFSALNKTDGSRECFISRYENGSLVQIDFEAYHLRLIADALDVSLPTEESIHRYLAKIYFNTDEITDEMYEESKRKSFELMYGMSEETYGFELFEKINQIKKAFIGKYVSLPDGRLIKVDNPNPNKLFNYYIQSLENIKTVPKLKKILDYIDYNALNAKLILYTYDSILLDMEIVDPLILEKIISILEEDGKYPVRTYVGKNYHNLCVINN